MMNGTISNRFATDAWLLVGGGIALWFAGRRREVRQRQNAPNEPLSYDEGFRLRIRLIRDAFLGGAAWIGLFLVLDWIF